MGIDLSCEKYQHAQVAVEQLLNQHRDSGDGLQKHAVTDVEKVIYSNAGMLSVAFN